MAASRLVLQARSQKELERLSLESEKIIKELEKKILKKGDKLELAGVKLQVVSTMPEDQVKIAPETSIEIAVAPKKSDILLAIDTSYSMSKDDYKPSRFDCAKKATLSFMSGKIGSRDRVGIMTFGYNYATHLPLTKLESSSLIQAEASLKAIKPAGRTSLSNIINGAVEIFETQGLPDCTKTLVLLTDGCDNIGESPIVAAAKAQAKGILIHSVLIGEKTHYDEEMLTELASVTGGIFCRAANEEALLKFYSELGGKFKPRAPEEIIVPEAEEKAERKEEGKFTKLLKQIKKKVW